MIKKFTAREVAFVYDVPPWLVDETIPRSRRRATALQAASPAPSLASIQEEGHLMDRAQHYLEAQDRLKDAAFFADAANGFLVEREAHEHNNEIWMAFDAQLKTAQARADHHALRAQAHALLANVDSQVSVLAHALERRQREDDVQAEPAKVEPFSPRSTLVELWRKGKKVAHFHTISTEEIDVRYWHLKGYEVHAFTKGPASQSYDSVSPKRVPVDLVTEDDIGAGSP